MRESYEIELPGLRFLEYWSKGQEVIKSSLLGFVLSYQYMIPAQYYIRRTFYYRIIVDFVTRSWVPRQSVLHEV